MVIFFFFFCKCTNLQNQQGIKEIFSPLYNVKLVKEGNIYILSFIDSNLKIKEYFFSLLFF